VHFNPIGQSSLGLNSAASTTLTFQNKGVSGNGASTFPGFTGTFNLTFTPTGGTLINIATFAYKLDSTPAEAARINSPLP